MTLTIICPLAIIALCVMGIIGIVAIYFTKDIPKKCPYCGCKDIGYLQVVYHCCSCDRYF